MCIWGHGRQLERNRGQRDGFRWQLDTEELSVDEPFLDAGVKDHGRTFIRIAMKFPELIEELIAVGTHEGGASGAVLYRSALTKAPTFWVLDVENRPAIRILDGW